MRKRVLLLTGVALIAGSSLTSCYKYKAVVGSGPNGKETKSSWNHYLLAGLIPLKRADNQKLAKEAENYEIFTRMTFFNGLIGGLTFGIYTPTKTTVTR